MVKLNAEALKICQPIRLYTACNDFVVTVLVPPFLTPPDWLMWGARVFRRDTDDVYREGLFYAVPPGMEDFDDVPAADAEG